MSALSAALPFDDDWWMHLRRRSASSTARAAWDRHKACRFRDFANVANCASLTFVRGAALPWQIGQREMSASLIGRLGQARFPSLYGIIVAHPGHASLRSLGDAG